MKHFETHNTRLGAEALRFLALLYIENESLSIGIQNVCFRSGFWQGAVGFGTSAVFDFLVLVRCHAGSGLVLVVGFWHSSFDAYPLAGKHAIYCTGLQWGSNGGKWEK